MVLYSFTIVNFIITMSDVIKLGAYDMPQSAVTEISQVRELMMM